MQKRKRKKKERTKPLIFYMAVYYVDTKWVASYEQARGVSFIRYDRLSMTAESTSLRHTDAAPQAGFVCLPYNLDSVLFSPRVHGRTWLLCHLCHQDTLFHLRDECTFPWYTLVERDIFQKHTNITCRHTSFVSLQQYPCPYPLILFIFVGVADRFFILWQKSENPLLLLLILLLCVVVVVVGTCHVRHAMLFCLPPLTATRDRDGDNNHSRPRWLEAVPHVVDCECVFGGGRAGWFTVVVVVIRLFAVLSCCIVPYLCTPPWDGRPHFDLWPCCLEIIPHSCLTEMLLGNLLYDIISLNVRHTHQSNSCFVHQSQSTSTKRW